MIINLSKPRAKYFADLTVTEILRKYIPKENPITLSDLKNLAKQGKVVVATKEASLDEFLAHNHTPQPLSLSHIVSQLEEDQLLIIPENYRIDAQEAHNIVAYSLDTLVKLDSAENQRNLGIEKSSGKISGKRKRELQLTPEKVISTAFNYLHEHQQELADKIFSCYSWWGKDNHRRIVSLYRAIQGAELRAFQDYTAFKLLIPTFKKELRTNIDAQTKKPLTPEEISDKRDKVERYERYIKYHNIVPDLARLEVDFNDLIDPIGDFSYQTSQIMHVPSRSQKDQKTYRLLLTDVPLLKPIDENNYSLVWELAGNCSDLDKLHQSNRRKPCPSKGNREDFFCPHEIAAAHTLRKKYSDKSLKNITYLPFVLPTKEMMCYIDTLRYNTIMLTYKEKSKRFSKRNLNHTEIENLLWKKVMAEGYEACFTTDINNFKEQRYDPHLDLIKFRG